MEGCSVTSLTVSFGLHGPNYSSAGLVLRMNDFFNRLMSDRGQAAKGSKFDLFVIG